MDEPNRITGADKPDKAQRLAEALRENLRKRKAQSRARRGGGGTAGGETKTDMPGGSNETGDEG